MPQWRHRKPRPLVHTVEAGLVISKSSYLQTNYEILAKFRGWCPRRAETNLWEQSFKIGKTKFCLRFKSQKKYRRNRSSRPEVFCKKGVPRNFAKFTGKHLCQRFFFNKVAGLACNFIIKESLAQVFSCKFCEISKNTFFYRTQVAASKITVFKKIRDSLTNFTFSF